MPLIHGKSPKDFTHNLKAEMHAGKPQKQSLAIAYAIKRKAQHHKAHGGMVHKEHEHEHEHQMHPKDEHEMHLAHGGMIGTEHEDHDFKDMDHHEEEMASGYEDEHDLVERAMHHYSKGGMIANGGEDELDHLADSKPNEFDELAKDDDLEFNYTGANSGDEIGNHHLDEEDEDVVSRAMRSFAKKDRLPNPR